MVRKSSIAPPFLCNLKTKALHQNPEYIKFFNPNERSWSWLVSSVNKILLSVREV